MRGTQQKHQREMRTPHLGFKPNHARMFKLCYISIFWETCFSGTENKQVLSQREKKHKTEKKRKSYMMWEWERVGIRPGFNVRWFDMIHRRVFLKWATSKTWRWSFTPISEAEFPGSDAGAEVLTQILGKLSFRDATQKCHTKTPANLQHPQPAVWAQIGLEMHINIDSV